MERVDVVIAGGGPAGLALCLALRQQGVEALVLDPTPGVQRAPRGELLQPNGLQVLDRLGVLQAVKERAVLNRVVEVFRPGGERLGRVDYGVLPPPWNYTLCHRPHVLREALLERLPGDAVNWGRRVSGLVRTRQAWELTVERVEEPAAQAGPPPAAGSGPAVRLRARVVVAADGARSQVRRLLGIRARVREYPDAYALAVVPRPAALVTARQVMGRGTLVGLLPVSTGEVYIYWYVPAGRVTAFKGCSSEEVIRRAASLIPDLGGQLQLPPGSEWLVLRPVRVTASTWVADGGALVGDAAHALNPNAGQGTNQSLEDALVLAELLADRLRRDRLAASDLAPYERARRPAATFVQNLGERYARLWTSPSALVERLNARFMRHLAGHGGLHRKVVAQTAGLAQEPLTARELLRLLLRDGDGRR